MGALVSLPLTITLGRNIELKFRLRMWEEGHMNEPIVRTQGQQNSGKLRWSRRPMQPPTDDQRGERASALTA